MGETSSFSLVSKLSARKLLCAIWGTRPSSHPFLELVPPSVWRASFLVISDELVLLTIWANQNFTQLIVHKELRVEGI